MSRLLKGGWHPERDSGRDTGGIRSSFKGVNQVAGLLGKGKSDSGSAEAARNHQAAPLSSLRDPAEFAPPPKHVGYHAADATSSTASPTASRPAPISSLGAPLLPEEFHSSRPVPQPRQAQAQQEEEEQPREPPGPFRRDTTGLSTAHLPKPPVRRIDGGAQSPASPTSRPKPSLPPRLPPRQSEYPDAYAPSPPPTYNDAVHDAPAASGQLDQGSLQRLGQAGVSVPGFDIGRTSSPSSTSGRQPGSPSGAQLSELQQRFGRMNTGSSHEQTSAPPTQAAMNVASSMRRNFGTNLPVDSAPASPTLGKKAPPPPPPKRKGLQNASEPPPIPLSSKPRP